MPTSVMNHNYNGKTIRVTMADNQPWVSEADIVDLFTCSRPTMARRCGTENRKVIHDGKKKLAVFNIAGVEILDATCGTEHSHNFCEWVKSLANEGNDTSTDEPEEKEDRAEQPEENANQQNEPEQDDIICKKIVFDSVRTIDTPFGNLTVVRKGNDTYYSGTDIMEMFGYTFPIASMKKYCRNIVCCNVNNEERYFLPESEVLAVFDRCKDNKNVKLIKPHFMNIIMPEMPQEEKVESSASEEQNPDNEIRVFENPEFGSIRTVMIDNEPWFVGRDITTALGYSNNRDALVKRVDDEDKGVAKCDTLGGVQDLAVINESGLYSLILSSKLSSAKKFKRWVTSEVLPSIRKHGAYMTPETLEKAILNPDVMIQICQNLKEEQEKNRLLKMTNDALVGEISTWNWRAVINSIVRAMAFNRFSRKFGIAWSNYYKTLQYKAGIALKMRKKSSLDGLCGESEIKEAVRVAVAWAEESGLDVPRIIGETNYTKATT